MKKSTKDALKFWGTVSAGAAIPGSFAAFMGAPWWGIALSALVIPFIIIGFMIFMLKIMTSIF